MDEMEDGVCKELDEMKEEIELVKDRAFEAKLVKWRDDVDHTVSVRNHGRNMRSRNVN